MAGRSGRASMSACAAVVLAAGSASRMGRPKQVLLFQGEALVARAVQAASASGCDPVIVVLGAHAAAVREVLDSKRVTLVENLRWETGLSSSIRAGLAAIGGADNVLLLLADQPYVTGDLVRRLRKALTDRYLAAACRYEGVVGTPFATAKTRM